MNEAPHIPIRTLSYGLTRADALAYKLLKHELTGWEKFRLIGFVIVGGMVVGLLPGDLPALVWWVLAAFAVALSAILAIIWMNVSVRRQAAAIPLPEGAVELEEWGDHIAETSATGTRHIAFETIAQVIRTEGHIFIREGAVPLIIPKWPSTTPKTCGSSRKASTRRVTGRSPETSRAPERRNDR